MKLTNTHSRRLLATAAASAVTAVATQVATAVPVTGQYLEDPRCDTIPSQVLTHELGDAATFPPNEAILIQVSPATFTVCVPDDNIQNDWIVQITNVSGQAWRDLFFVGDLGMRVGNADGNMIDVVNAPGVVTDAFRIDGTVTAGINNNLLNESFPGPDEIFSPGETWRFNVSNFAGPANLAPPPIMSTPGIFAGSDSIFPLPPTNTASILANPIPEPATVAGLLLVAGALLMRRPQRA
jgi:hypothetical protein